MNVHVVLFMLQFVVFSAFVFVLLLPLVQRIKREVREGSPVT